MYNAMKRVMIERALIILVLMVCFTPAWSQFASLMTAVVRGRLACDNLVWKLPINVS